MDDKDIIRQVLNGDNDAFALLVERYQTRLYNLALRMCGNEDDAFDLTQEAFVKAWRNLGSFQQEAAFSTWLFRLTSNVCIDFLRAKKRRTTVSLTMREDDSEDSQLDLPDPAISPEEAVIRSEDRQALARAMNELPVEYRQILTLRAIDDLSYSQIAQVLELEEGTVKSRLSRARARLREKLLSGGNKSAARSSIHQKGRDAK